MSEDMIDAGLKKTYVFGVSGEDMEECKLLCCRGCCLGLSAHSSLLSTIKESAKEGGNVESLHCHSKEVGGIV